MMEKKLNATTEFMQLSMEVARSASVFLRSFAVKQNVTNHMKVQKPLTPMSATSKIFFTCGHVCVYVHACHENIITYGG